MTAPGFCFLTDTYFADEERHLVSFFGQAYIDYRNSTPVRIPFIR
jgi:protein-S-isoprenylcysteine O-methyltransferase Ste14